MKLDDNAAPLGEPIEMVISLIREGEIDPQSLSGFGKITNAELEGALERIISGLSASIALSVGGDWHKIKSEASSWLQTARAALEKAKEQGI